MQRAEYKNTTDDLQSSVASAVKATTNAAYSKITDDLYDGFTPEEILHIQMLDQIVANKPKRSLFKTRQGISRSPSSPEKKSLPQTIE